MNSSSPQFIITPQNEAHVQAAVICSRNLGLGVRVRSGGHDYEGLSYKAAGPFVIIDLVNLTKVSVSLDTSTAWVESGATLGELYYQIATRSSTLGFPAGVCPTIGVGGHFSGGGQGTMTRKYGLASDNVLDAIMVDANGTILDRESMSEDLFWAIRGGGGASFGVILSWKIKLVPVPPIVTICNVPKTLEQGATKLAHLWQQIAPKLHEDINMRVIITLANNTKGEKTAQALFNSLYLGTIQQLIPLMNVSFPELGLAAKDCHELSWVQTFAEGESVKVLMNRSHEIKGYFKGKSDYVNQPIPESGLEGMWKVFLEGEAGVMIWDPYGGKMSEIAEDETPFPHRAGILYNIQYFSKWEEAGVEAQRKHMEWTNNIYKYMTPFVSKSPRRAFLNYKDIDLGRNDENGNTSFSQAGVWGQSYFKNNFKRLALVKGRVDPSNFFRDEQSIPPLM
ncbi:hypothetical protein PVL29_013446 [Vitis rotundifolia]|uniref:FAD-binding PCMH-type domain-containing protein n=1 Tax=Vitis rotundifolia TaxID=103349 RepID=A0AA38ZMD8_VITRO|nr:hypothetical protein PVL29_013446 [Vitis rotundifolia]